MKKQRLNGGRGVLLIVSLFLATSGALRIGAGVGAALANSAAEIKPVAETQNCAETPSALAEAMGKREAAVAAREVAVENRVAALAVSEAAINQRIEEMTSVEAELKKTLQIADGAAEADLARLTAVYEAMKPADAAKVFSKMAPEFAAGFLGRMNPGAAAAVLAGMPADEAYSISVLIAGRNALVPKN
jgi:flagellar motility protein MotE (MotC chaperone)